MLAMFMVTNNDDALENTPAAVGTLRQAIFDAENLIGSDTIKFDPTEFASGGTITLTEGQLTISESVTIDGTNSSGVPLGITIDASGNDPTPNSTPLDGNPADDGDGTSVFSISPFADNSNITLVGLTITGGDQGFGLGGGVQYVNSSFNSSLTILKGLVEQLQ